MNRTADDTAQVAGLRGLGAFLARRRRGRRFDITDALTYLYLLVGVVVMFGPVLWLVMSSFKDESLLFERTPTFLPYRQASAQVDGHDRPLPLYEVTANEVTIAGARVTLADLRAANGVVHGLDRILWTPALQEALAALDTSAADPAAWPAPSAPVPLGGVDGSVWEVTRARAEFSVMAALLAHAGLEGALSGEERRTLLAPSDDAFAQFVDESGAATAAALLLPENAALLERLLLGHVLDDRYLLVNLFRSLGEPVPTLAGTSWTLEMVPGETRRLAQIGSPQGASYTMLDPQNPAAGELNVLVYMTPIGPSTQLTPIREVYFNIGNYTGAMRSFAFWTYLRNSVVVTVVATIITLIINSMAAFALSKYQFRGREAVFLIIISTLMVPISVIMIPAFLVISQVGWVNNLWGLIIPGAATPTGVFLLRQYMLTIPDELLDSARIDGASEWRIYWQIMLPLARPALAVLAIFSIMWRWNDFLWPLIVVSRNELFTLQVGLNAFQGALDVQWHYILAMTVLTLLPITVVFAFLQRFITSGIATTGMKG
jgi:alpha-1,4-digalacturonate transport system permease protein